MSNQCNLGLKT